MPGGTCVSGRAGDSTAALPSCSGTRGFAPPSSSPPLDATHSTPAPLAARLNPANSMSAARRMRPGRRRVPPWRTCLFIPLFCERPDHAEPEHGEDAEGDHDQERDPVADGDRERQEREDPDHYERCDQYEVAGLHGQ